VTAPLPEVVRAPAPDWITPEKLDARCVDGDPFPIVDGDICAFAFARAAEEVRLTHFGVGLPADLDFEPLGESDWWLLALRVPAGSRIEYKLEIVDSFGVRFIEDPLNPQGATHPFGANSVCTATGYERPDWTHPDPAAPSGRIVDFELESAAYGRIATTSVYLPGEFSDAPDAPYPLLIVHDGGDYLQYAEASTVLDNLIHRGDIPPTVAVFLHPAERLVEYADDERHATFLAGELVPDLERELPLVGAPSGRCVMGASFGAVATLATAWRAPGFFGRLLLQSGSFAGVGVGCRRRPEPLWRPVRDFVRSFIAAPAAVAERVFVSAGVYESLICENRALVPVLRATGMDVRFVEELDGHNWACWRDDLGLALPWLLKPGQ